MTFPIDVNRNSEGFVDTSPTQGIPEKTGFIPGQFIQHRDSGRNRIVVFIKSKKTPIRLTEISIPGLFPKKQVVVVYGYLLDEQQEKVVEEARLLGKIQGLKVEIKDLTRENPLLRAFRRLFSRSTSLPIVQIPGSLFDYAQTHSFNFHQSSAGVIRQDDRDCTLNVIA